MADIELPALADEVLQFWFPDDGHDKSVDTHGEFWFWRMQGGADDAIVSRFSQLTEDAARGLHDDWAATARGRLALIIVLDQFSRSLWRDDPRAFGQDIKSARLAIEALDNGHFEELAHVWEKTFLLICIGHCEGPDHLARMNRIVALADRLQDEAPEILRPLYKVAAEQPRLTRSVIERFGRHPHRNSVLGRISTPDEESYVATGAFPHNRSREDFEASMRGQR